MTNVIGYVLQPDGRYHHKFYFAISFDNIAAFIMMHRFSTVIITDTGDNLICSTLPGGFIDACPDRTLLEPLVLVLTYYQQGQPFEPLKFVEDEPGCMVQVSSL